MNDQLYIEKQLDSRKDDSISKLFTSAQNLDKQIPSSLILTANTDLGVVRNGGKKGSQYGANSIVANLKKMASHCNNHQVKLADVNNIRDELSYSFDEMQDLESSRIYKSITNFIFSNIIHIGGGHDHIYPLIKAYSKIYKKIKILNIDAHLDTRVDTSFHSGTPFRQAHNLKDVDIDLFQFGIKQMSNAVSNYENLDMKITTMNQIEQIDFCIDSYLANFLKNTNDDQLIILSLDTDAINSGHMEAVSAVNPTGLSFKLVQQCYQTIQEYCQKNKKSFVTGIYEYNPLFDNLSNKGSRLLAELIYQIISK